MKTCIQRSIVICLSLLLSGCWWPEEFTATLEINSDKTYNFTYDGILAYAPAVAQIKEKGALSAHDEAELKKGEVDLMKENGFKSVSYKSKGRFAVTYQKSGVVDRKIKLLGDSLDIVTLEPTGDGIKVTGLKLDQKSRSEVQQIGLGLDGKVRILSGLAVLSHNADSQPTLGVGSHEWHITLSDQKVPEFLTSGVAVPKPVAAEVTGSNRVILVVGLVLAATLIWFLVKGRAARQIPPSP